jgi:hypothetical protein
VPGLVSIEPEPPANPAQAPCPRPFAECAVPSPGM